MRIRNYKKQPITLTESKEFYLKAQDLKILYSKF